MTKGKALILARKVLGPTGHVKFDSGLPFPCKVGTFDQAWECKAVGRTWEEALSPWEQELRKMR